MTVFVDVLEKFLDVYFFVEDEDVGFERPIFQVPLQDKTVTEGAIAKFECKISGIPDPEVKW